MGEGASSALGPLRPPPHRQGGLLRFATTEAPAAGVRGLPSLWDHRGPCRVGEGASSALGHRAPRCAARVQRGTEHYCQRAHEGHRMDKVQARVAAQAVQAWLQPAAGQGRHRGGVPGRVGFAKRGQTPPLVITLTNARDATSAPSRARVRATPRGALSPPPHAGSRGGGGSLSGSGMLNERGGLRQPFPPSPLPPRGAAGQDGAHGERLQASRAPAGRPGLTHMRGGGYNRVLTPPPLPRAGEYFWGHLPPADGRAGGVISYKGGH